MLPLRAPRSTVHGLTSAPGHQPAREYCQVTAWLLMGLEAQSSRHTVLDCACWPLTATAWGSLQNSAQLYLLPWPWPLTNRRTAARVVPAGSATLAGDGPGRLGSPTSTLPQPSGST